MSAAGIERGDSDYGWRVRAGSRIWPLLVNGPSREPPVAR